MDVKIKNQRIYLPNDIIIEIFLKLQVRSLVQLMCVCKTWKIIISDPQFAKKHLHNSTMKHRHQRLFSSTTNIGLQDSCSITSLPINPLFENPSNPIKVDRVTKSPNYDIIGSCDGLLCLYNRHYDKYVKLWNPCTRLESKRSPMITSWDDHLRLICCGFGYDQVNDKYKAVLIYKDYDSSETVTKVYNFGTYCLKTIKNLLLNRHCSLRMRATGTHGTHLRSTLNWVANRYRDKKQVILSFDLEKETYGEVLLPKHDGCNYFDPVLGVLRNCLCVCFHTKEIEGVVWLMKDYGVVESWTKLMLVIPRYKSWMPPVEPLCISENGVVLFQYRLNKPTKLVLYDPINGTEDLYDPINGTEDYPRILSTIERDQFIMCYESLISPLW